MSTKFSGYQIASLVRLVGTNFNVRINKAGNIAIEPSVVTNPNCKTKYIFYATKNGFVIRRGNTKDIRQKDYGEIGTPTGEVDKYGDKIYRYNYPTFKEAYERFKALLKRAKKI